MYTLVDLDLDTDEIPANMSSIIINGPQWDYEENELYKIDQFIMRGGNVMVMIDGLVQDATKGGSYQMPAYSANVSNLDELLNHYGVERGFNFVMDKNSYETNSQQYGKMNMYWAPVLQKGQMPKKNIITNKNYRKLLISFFNNSQLIKNSVPIRIILYKNSIIIVKIM